jgi:beta-glucosidase
MTKFARRLALLFLFAAFGTFVLFAQLGTGSPLPGAPRPAPTGIYDPKLDGRVEALLRQMTREEKVGQLVQYSAGQPTGPGTGRSGYNEMIEKGQIGCLYNVTDPRAVNAYQRLAVEKSRLHIPIIFALDVIHGFRTEFPIPLGLASTWDPGLVEKAARVAAQEASAGGIRWTFSPMVDIARDPRWGRMAEGAGEDPFLGSAMAAAYVRGYQGQRLDAPDSIAACAKHYVGYGAAEGGRDYNSTEISELTLRHYYLPPFSAAVDAGAASIMSAFNSIDGIPASANSFTLKQILRKEWGFRGIVDSDWEAIEELIPHGIARDGSEAARKAFLAGVDVDMVSSLYHDHLEQLVASGKVSDAELDEAVRHVLRVKFALGLFGRPYVDDDAAEKVPVHAESLTVALEAAERSFVLLQNQSGSAGKPLLPISSEVKNVALLGPLADDRAMMLGSWSGLSRAEDVTTLRKALVARLGEDRVFQARGTGITDGTDEEIAAAVSGAANSDLIILALGENAGEMTGEAASRTKLGLPGRQQQLLEAAVHTGKPVALVLFSGRPLILPWAFEHVSAVLAAWFPGTEAGPALVRTLIGDVNPSGKLVVSWPRSVGQIPLYYNALNTGRPAGKTDLSHAPGDTVEKYVSRYIDEFNSPQFVFGYGGSYTTFAYGPAESSAKKLSASELNKGLGNGAAAPAASLLTVEADLSNTGSRAGEEVAQLYLRLEGTSVAQPVRALKGFQRVPLAPGTKQRVRFTLPPEAFAIWNERNKFAVEPAKATLWIGPDSSHGSEVSLEIVP